MNRRHALSAIMAAVALPAAAPAAPAWERMPLLKAAVADAKANIPGFGSSAADTFVSGATTPTMYIDTKSGSESYDGLSDVFDGTHGPKAKMPAATSAADEFWAVLTGSVITTDYSPNLAVPRSVNRALTVLHPGFKIAAWSRKHRQEVTPATPGFSNPFDSILNTGAWADAVYLEDHFFKFAANGHLSGYTRGSDGAAIGIGPDARDTVVRGAWCDGHPLGLVNSNGPPYTAEDWYITRAYRAGEAGQASGVGTGCAFRHEADDVPGCRLARGMTGPQSIGEDLFHTQPTVGGNGPHGASIADCVLLHDCVRQDAESLHCDIWQMGHGPGDMVMRRVLMQHILQDRPLPNVQGNAKSLPQGCAIMIPNGNGGTHTAAPSFTDVLIATNSTALNTGAFTWTGTFTWNRFEVYTVRNQQLRDPTGNNIIKCINYGNRMSTRATNCRLVFVNPHFTPTGSDRAHDGYFNLEAAASIASGVTFG